VDGRGAESYYSQKACSPRVCVFVCKLRQYRAVRDEIPSKIFHTSGFWPRVRACALRAPVFFGLINTQKGALRAPPPPIAAPLLLIHPQKINTVITILCSGFELGTPA
jgi:hypothetical protein